MAYEDGKLLAILPATIDRSTGEAISHGGLTFGGLVVERRTRSDRSLAALDVILEALRSWGATSLSVRMMPSFLETYPSAELGYGLWLRGFKLTRRDLSSILPIKGRLKLNSSKKQAISKARKEGLVVSSDIAVKDFYPLLSEVLSDRHNTNPVHSAEELERLISIFPENIQLRSVQKQGEAIAGALVFRYPTAWHTQYLASSEAGRACGALDLIIGSLIEEAEGDGATWFSFGTSTTEAGRVINDGLLWQKESFGARAVTHDTLSGTL